MLEERVFSALGEGHVHYAYCTLDQEFRVFKDTLHLPKAKHTLALHILEASNPQYKIHS